MKLLSERIEQADYDCETLWRYLEEAGHPPDGDAVNTLKAVMQTLLGCERLAKRYEDAPVATFRWDWASDTLAAGVVEEKNPSLEQLEKFKAIQDRARVRILLDTEGV